MGLRTILRKLLKAQPADPFLNESYAQEGEDSLLKRYFDGKTDGFYIDIGAHHPKRFSNTYIFYKQGWRGINIDAMPGSMKEFDKIRPEDINLEIPVANSQGMLLFHVFNDTALNTFSPEVAAEREQKNEYKVEKIMEIETQTMAAILDKHMPAGKQIDFISIDAEGLDYDILLSNNWEKYPATIVLVESEYEFNDFIASPLYQFMQSKGYGFFAKTVKTYFLKRIEKLT